MSIPLIQSTTLSLVLDTPKGRGVFAAHPIPAGTLIDTAPVIVLSTEDWTKHVQHTILAHYTFTWPQKDVLTDKLVMHQAVVFGLGSMFNHSRLRQNVGWKRDIDAGVVMYTTLRYIEEGEELLISYGDKLWFKDVDGDTEGSVDTAEEILGVIDFD